MRAPVPLAVPRLPALALLLAYTCAVAPGAQAQTTPEKPPPLPSGGPAAAHAHPRARPPTTAPANASALVVPAVPPAPPDLPPAIVVPTRPPPMLTPPPVAADAPDTTSKTADSLRIVFGAERSDLNPASNDAIANFALAIAASDATFTVTAFAPGGDDPSTPRRLSLSRALAVRSALMQAGIASVRIYVKALGAAAPQIDAGPPDRVDVVVAVPPPPSSTQTATPAATPGQPAPTQKAAP